MTFRFNILYAEIGTEIFEFILDTLSVFAIEFKTDLSKRNRSAVNISVMAVKIFLQSLINSLPNDIVKFVECLNQPIRRKFRLTIAPLFLQLVCCFLNGRHISKPKTVARRLCLLEKSVVIFCLITVGFKHEIHYRVEIGVI